MQMKDAIEKRMHQKTYFNRIPSSFLNLEFFIFKTHCNLDVKKREISETVFGANKMCRHRNRTV